MKDEIKAPRKLIEVALPLDAINEACVREKSIRHGHPSTLHLWWSRKPLAAARAVLFAQLVNDPSWKWEMETPDKIPPNHLKASWAASRKRLFQIIQDIVKWENTTNQEVLQRARTEIRRSWQEVCELNKDHPQAAELFNPDKLPAFHDPFAGGGSIPLEAQRLGLEAYASDLNPVAVLINKAMIEIPPKFANNPPIHPISTEDQGSSILKDWPGATGLAEDVRFYGAWMREQAQKRIGHLYPPVEITPEMAAERPDLEPLIGQKLTVIAWQWARTIKSPNPAFSHVDVPLTSKFIFSSKTGKEAYVQPIIEGDKYRFTVKIGKPPKEAENGTSAGKRKAFRCLISNTPIDYDYIRSEGRSGRMRQKLMAIVAEGSKGRIYLAPSDEMEIIAAKATPSWKPDCEMPKKHRNFQPPVYGMNNLGDIFTPRQLVALTTFSDLVSEARERIRQDAVAAGMPDDGKGIDIGGIGATGYAEAVSVYLGFLVGQIANHSSTICGWNHQNTQMRSVFSRQAIPMTWDYAESNIFSESSGSYLNLFDRQLKAIGTLGFDVNGVASQVNAQTQNISSSKIISTDPPYYDNIAYADLSDFFYVWLRKSLRQIFPNLLATVAVPKAEELVATPYRHGSKEKAEKFFLSGMLQAIHNIAIQAHPSTPITIYYAFKQSETKNSDDTSSPGWETFLEAIHRSDLQLCGTWPMRTEREGRSIAIDTNSLASSIVLVCRKRSANAPTISRRDFMRELNTVLPQALEEMTTGAEGEHSPVAPVDLSQAIIGPGMAVFSKYSAVLEADGTPMSVRTALQLINRFLAGEDFDAGTQFCLNWLEQHSWEAGVFGEADVLARSKSTSVEALKEAGVLKSGGGKVQLLKWQEYPNNWEPQSHKNIFVWQALHHLIRALKQDGESASGALLNALSDKIEAVRQLAYRLYTLCERKGQAEEARAYNEIMTSWTSIESCAATLAKPTNKQIELFNE